MCPIVQLRGGTILVIKATRKSSPPTVVLPRTGAVPIPAAILVVDDQKFVRQTLRSLLAQQPDWKIYEAENGKVALDKIREIHPDVVVLDIVMPEMNGIEAAYEIHRLKPTPKIVLISSQYTPEESAILARLFGDGDFIPKSEVGKTLVPTVSRLLLLTSPVAAARRGIPHNRQP